MDAYGVIRILGIAALLASASVQSAKIHEQMTDEEIANLFHTTRDNIPEYDVVPIRHNLHKRSDQDLRVRFTALGRKIYATLNPSDGQLAGENTPVWLAFTNANGTIEYKKLRNDVVGLAARVFSTPQNQSYIIVGVTKGGNDTSLEGVVDGLIIRPLPERFQEATKKKRDIRDSDASRTLFDTRYHVVIKSRSMEEEQKLTELEGQIREATRSANVTGASKVKRSLQDIIYPSLLIRTDYKGSKTTQDELAYYDEIVYQLAFWNAVDMRYRHVENPKIRLRIAGIVIGQDRNATPYFHNHMVDGAINTTSAWDDIQTYYGNLSDTTDFPLEAYDIIVTMTDSAMIAVTDTGITHILGFARLGGLCMEVYERYHAIVAIRDMGGFDGVLTATHEMGHMMGLYHDGKRGDECDQSHGYIMQPNRVVSVKNMEWSPCSLRALAQLMRNQRINCVDQPADYHPPGAPVPRFSPGDLAKPHKQCQARGFSWACDPNPETCTQLKCYHYWTKKMFEYGWSCMNSGPAAEGTTCGHDHKCIDGVCECIAAPCTLEIPE